MVVGVELAGVVLEGLFGVAVETMAECAGWSSSGGDLRCY